MTTRVFGLAVLVLGLSVWVGCGADNPLNRQAISGTVAVDGQPVKEGSIKFIPVDKGPTISGAPIRDGQFAMSAEKGLPPGQYEAVVSAPDYNAPVPQRPPGDPPAAPPELLPRGKNTQKVTVSDSGSNQFNLEYSTR